MSEPAKQNDWLERYQAYLEKICGFGENTQRSYLYMAKRFLQEVDVSQPLAPENVLAFVVADAQPRKGQGAAHTSTRTRAFLRFLILQGLVHAGFDAAVPSIKQYRQARLPSFMSDREIEQVLSFFRDDNTEQAIRSYALLLLLARLGLRISEAAALRLDDIDWRHGLLTIGAGKNKRERKLPLQQDVGDALVRYIRDVRPKVANRHIFVQSADSSKAYCSDSLAKSVRRMLARAGLKPPRGPHLFRHAAATKLVNQGATFKQVADLIGHESLLSTKVYAKLNLHSLGQIPLPWPGGSDNE